MTRHPPLKGLVPELVSTRPSCTYRLVHRVGEEEETGLRMEVEDLLRPRVEIRLAIEEDDRNLLVQVHTHRLELCQPRCRVDLLPFLGQHLIPVGIDPRACTLRRRDRRGHPLEREVRVIQGAEVGSVHPHRHRRAIEEVTDEGGEALVDNSRCDADLLQVACDTDHEIVVRQRTGDLRA